MAQQSLRGLEATCCAETRRWASLSSRPAGAGGRAAASNCPPAGAHTVTPVKRHCVSGKTDLTCFMGSEKLEGFSEGHGIKPQQSHGPVRHPASPEVDLLEGQNPGQRPLGSPTRHGSAEQARVCTVYTRGLDAPSPETRQSPGVGLKGAEAQLETQGTRKCSTHLAPRPRCLPRPPA